VGGAHWAIWFKGHEKDFKPTSDSSPTDLPLFLLFAGQGEASCKFHPKFTHQRSYLSHFSLTKLYHNKKSVSTPRQTLSHTILYSSPKEIHLQIICFVSQIEFFPSHVIQTHWVPAKNHLLFSLKFLLL
jgi:hypothetical protein